MMPRKPSSQLLEIMQRTMVNLQYVEGGKAVDGPFEVTQLINSFLGALAHPWEKYRDELNRMPLADAWRNGWPVFIKGRSTDKELETLGEQLAYIRHGIAHGNIKMLDKGGRGKITHLEIWNEKPPGKRIWGTKINVEQLRQSLDLFVDLAEQLVAKDNAVRRES